MQMKSLALALVCLLLSALDAPAQKDFLTADEVDKVREVQEPNQRLELYLLFARQRIDRLKQTVAKEKKGRSLQIRGLLEEYTQILDAIDTVSDDALKRKIDISVGSASVSKAEKGFLETLGKIQENPPHDFDLYDVAFKDAYENTRDSIELASSDLGERQDKVIAKDRQEKADVKSVLTAKERHERAEEQQKAEKGTALDPNARKPPTLYRKGEKPDTGTGGGTPKTAPPSSPPLR